MKKNLLYILIGLLLAPAFSSCDEFGNINNNPEYATDDNMDFKMMFTGTQVFVSGRDWADWRNNLIYSSTMMQHLSSVQGHWNGDKYTYNAGYNAAYFDSYDSAVKKLMATYHAWKDKPEWTNEFQMVRILRVILFHRMTDLYGDVPYSEAGLGYISQIYFPKYDTQKDIYMDMLKELEEAATTLDPTLANKISNADIMHQGNIAAWQKTAYSFMLRLGMRLSKVDAAEAQKWSKKAYDGGLIASNSENCIIKHEIILDDGANAIGKVLCYLDPDASRISNTFVDMLKASRDPRLQYIATVCKEPKHASQSPRFQLGDTTMTKQLGMPNGYDLNDGSRTHISLAPNWPGDDLIITFNPSTNKNDTIIEPGINKYSVVNRYTFSRLDAPTFVITNAENKLLLAEAAHRGWVPGNAAQYYKEGVTAAMEQYTEFGNGIRIPAATIDAYLTRNPFNLSTAYEQINTQYWIATFGDEYETFANWRRSGQPVLVPINYRGNVTNGTVPRRFTYREDEANNNETHYLDAVLRLSGGDKMTSRVWWDVP